MYGYCGSRTYFQRIGERRPSGRGGIVSVGFEVGRSIQQLVAGKAVAFHHFSQFLQSIELNLVDALTSQPDLVPDLFQCRSATAVQPEATLDDSALDVLTYRAERLRMLARTSTEHYQRILGELDLETRKSLADRQQQGGELRPFSLGIGGLDLGMEKVLDRASGTRLGLGRAAGTDASGGATDEPTRSPFPCSSYHSTSAKASRQGQNAGA